MILNLEIDFDKFENSVSPIRSQITSALITSESIILPVKMTIWLKLECTIHDVSNTFQPRIFSKYREYRF